MSHFEIESLALYRGEFRLEASLSLEKGYTGVILGPSGCGKTSLLRCVAGLERQDSGSIRLGGREIGNLEPGKRSIGFVFQDLALFDHLSGRGNLEFGLRRRGVDAKLRISVVERLSRLLHIEDLLDRKPSMLSGGERQRLAVARSLAYSPELLLLDEPLSSLDAPLKRELRGFLATAFKESGATSLHVTHDTEEAFELADMLFLMRNGKILAEGRPSDLYSHPPNDFTATFLGLGSLLDIRSAELGESACTVVTGLGNLRFDPELIPGNRRLAERGQIPPGLLQNPGAYRVFVPKRALAAEANARLPTAAGMERAVMQPDSCVRLGARIARLAFAGDTMLVEARTGSEAGGIVLVFETSPQLGFRLGDWIPLALDTRLCSILPKV
ncbi:MAG TPA: ABC transporter ATP-binding protein [Rectinemataceae bacterium]